MSAGGMGGRRDGTHSEVWAQMRSNASRCLLISSGSGWGRLWALGWWMLPYCGW